MNRTPYLALAVILFVALPARAGNSDQDLGPCGDFSTPAPKRIEACTALIGSGTLSAEKKVAVLKNRAQAYYTANQYEHAIGDYDEVIRIEPDDWLTIYNRGSAYHALGQYARAVENYSETIRLKPDDALAYVSRSMVKRQSGDSAGADADLAKACAIDSSAFYCK